MTMDILVNSATLVVLVFTVYQVRRHFQLNNLASFRKRFNEPGMFEARIMIGSSGDCELNERENGPWMATKLCDFYDEIGFLYFHNLIDKKGVRLSFVGPIIWHFENMEKHVAELKVKQGIESRLIHFEMLYEEMKSYESEHASDQFGAIYRSKKHTERGLAIFRKLNVNQR